MNRLETMLEESMREERRPDLLPPRAPLHHEGAPKPPPAPPAMPPPYCISDQLPEPPEETPWPAAEARRWASAMFGIGALLCGAAWLARGEGGLFWLLMGLGWLSGLAAWAVGTGERAE